MGRLLCCGEAGEKEKESARGTMGRGKREDILMGIPSGSLCGGESHAPESERVARVSMFDTHASLSFITLVLEVWLEDCMRSNKRLVLQSNVLLLF